MSHGLHNRIRRTIVLLAAVTVLLLMLGACTSADKNLTPEPAPTAVVTPTPPFHNPVETNLHALAEPVSPIFLGHRQNVWNLAKDNPITQTVSGDGGTDGWFRFLWEEDAVYVLVRVNDNTFDTGADDVYERDSVVIYINEDGRKNLRYAVGDAFYAVDRSGRGYVGRGGAEEDFVCSVYEDPEAKGNAYYAEFRIPLRSVTGRYDREIGFDVRINNAFEGECVHVVQWADTSGKTEITMTGVGTVRMD